MPVIKGYEPQVSTLLAIVRSDDVTTKDNYHNYIKNPNGGLILDGYISNHDFWARVMYGG